MPTKLVKGERTKIIKNAGYIIRNTIKVIGTKEIKPANFGIFYNDLSNPMDGGTGHTMRVCLKNKVPLIDQRVWFDWV